MSQFSAAVADTIGGGGNIHELTGRNLSLRDAYIMICAVAIALSFFHTFAILTLASKAFAAYYVLQCLIAAHITSSASRALGFRGLALVLFFIVIFAVPMA